MDWSKSKIRTTVLAYIYLLAVTIQSCTMVNVSVSNKRNPALQTLEFGKNLKVTTWGAIKVNKADFFPSSFQILSKGIVLYIDPVETDISEKADYIFITHGHPDHFSIKTIEKIVKPETIIICPKNVSKKLFKKDYNIKEVGPGQLVDLAGIQCKSVHAYNTKNVFLWIKAHPKSKQNVGYILTLTDNTRIYHTGDTDYITEMENINDIDIVMVPIGGDNLTMNINEAAKMVNKIKPKIAIPMHYELKNEDVISQFRNLINEEVKVKSLE